MKIWYKPCAAPVIGFPPKPDTSGLISGYYGWSLVVGLGLYLGWTLKQLLRLVVDRDRSIADFVPVAYWAIDVDLRHDRITFTAQWRAAEDACDDQGRCLNPQLARDAADAMANAATARLVKLRTERMREVAPLPFDLGTLQEICSKKLGLGAQETLDIAQSLYETHKAITYPRSDCGYLPLSQHSDAPKILAAKEECCIVRTIQARDAAVQEVSDMAGLWG